jgi:hypothetical protein
MKFAILSAACLFALATSAPALAGELADQCRERLAADGRDTSGCDCLEKAVQDNPGLVDELTALGEIEDPAERYASASASAKAVMDKCTRS